MSQDMSQLDTTKLTTDLQAIALAAGAEIMEIYAQEFSVEMKEDRSPVTQADQRARDGRH